MGEQRVMGDMDGHYAKALDVIASQRELIEIQRAIIENDKLMIKALEAENKRLLARLVNSTP